MSAPEPRCATCGSVEAEHAYDGTGGHPFKPAPPSSGRPCMHSNGETGCFAEIAALRAEVERLEQLSFDRAALLNRSVARSVVLGGALQEIAAIAPHARAGNSPIWLFDRLKKVVRIAAVALGHV